MSKESKFLQQLTAEMFSNDNVSIDEIYRKQIETQRDYVFSLLRDWFVLTIESLYTEHGQTVLNETLRDKKLSETVNILRIRNLQEEKPSDLNEWIPLLSNFMLSEAPFSMLLLDQDLHNFNIHESTEKLIRSMVKGDWTLRKKENTVFTYGFILFMALNMLLEDNAWESNTYKLIGVLDHCTREFILFSTSSQMGYIEDIKEIAQEISDKKERMNAENTKSLRLREKQRGTAKHIYKQLNTGKYDDLQGQKFSELLTEASRIIRKYNRKDKIIPFSPTTEKHLKPILSWHFQLNPTEKLPNPIKIKFNEKLREPDS